MMMSQVWFSFGVLARTVFRMENEEVVLQLQDDSFQHFSFVLRVSRIVLRYCFPYIFCQGFLSDIPVALLPSRVPLSLPPSPR